MMTDKAKPLVLQALRMAVGEPTEQRLYRGGKLCGLFPSRIGTSGEAAAFALHSGLLEIVRTEIRGKVNVDWVRPTPAGIDYLHTQESPLGILNELRDQLAGAASALPKWVAEVDAKLETLSDQLQREVKRWTACLESLALRVEDSLRRVEAAGGSRQPGRKSAPIEILAYLDRRRDLGLGEPCALPELFLAVRSACPELSVPMFHEELRRLRDRNALKLVPVNGNIDQLAEPEYALPEGAVMYWEVTR